MTKVIVGLSGGVDSSVAAMLLLQQGYEVEALFMKNWDEDDSNNNCAAATDFADATKVADKLGIKLHSVNFSAEYWSEVFEDFIAQHQKARTPNPDVLCNEKIKFKAFLDYALKLGADKIATGHYAKIHQTKGEYQLLSATDTSKDQSYFLHRLSQKQLALSIFPLGDMTKQSVRLLAKKHNLITADKKDSTGICFIGEKNFRKFLANYIPKKQGDIIDAQGRFIKHHQGLAFYTIGQRKGLEIGGGFSDSGKPWFVAQKNIKTNEIVVVQGEHKLLYHQNLIAINTHWINKQDNNNISCQAKIRYRQTSQQCVVKITHNCLEVSFKEKQRAITPGQAIVFYQNNHCLGGAIIDSGY